MNAVQLTEWANRAATNISDPYDRGAVAEKVREAAALLTGIKAGLTAATPDGHEIASAVDAQLGSALLSLRMLADRLQLGAVYEPTRTVEVDDDLVDATSPMYALTGDQLAAIRAASFRAGVEAREPVLA